MINEADPRIIFIIYRFMFPTDSIHRITIHAYIGMKLPNTYVNTYTALIRKYQYMLYTHWPTTNCCNESLQHQIQT